MILGKQELLKKFAFLERYKDSKWFADLSTGDPQNLDKALFELTKIVLDDMIEFTEKTKFLSTWELCFSVKHRLLQIKQLINFFEQNKNNPQLQSCKDEDQISY